MIKNVSLHMPDIAKMSAFEYWFYEAANTELDFDECFPLAKNPLKWTALDIIRQLCNVFSMSIVAVAAPFIIAYAASDRFKYADEKYEGVYQRGVTLWREIK